MDVLISYQSWSVFEAKVKTRFKCKAVLERMHTAHHFSMLKIWFQVVFAASFSPIYIKLSNKLK